MTLLLAFLISQAQAQTQAPQKFECNRSVFTEVDEVDTEQIKNSFMSISSLPYVVDVVEKRGHHSVLRITYQWPKAGDQYRQPVNPAFSSQVKAHLSAFKTKRVWTETASKHCR